MNLPGFNRPVFIARFLNNELKYIENFPEFDGVIADANMANHFSNLWGKVVEKKRVGNIKYLMVDPNTAKMEHRVCVQKKTYQKLSYCPEVDGLVADDFLGVHGDTFSENFVSNVLSTQDDLSADILLTPYFVARSTTSPWHNVNLKLYDLSIKEKQKMQYEQPLFVSVCISIGGLQSDTAIEQLIRDLSDLEVNGYYIMIEGFSDRACSSEELMSVRKLVEGISEYKKPIINAFVDGFGLFLSGFGSSGFCAGICWLESFNEENFTAVLDEGRKADTMRERFIYIPETFIKFPVDRAQLIYKTTDGLKSQNQSNYYNRQTIAWPDRARYHFLDCRYSELKDLENLSTKEIRDNMNSRLDNAISLCKTIAENDIQVRGSHLKNWQEAIQ